MKWQWLVVIILISSSLMIMLLLWNVPVSTTKEVLHVKINVTEERVITVNVSEEPQKAFFFGATFPGTGTSKTMRLSRHEDAPPPIVNISVDGAVASWASLSENDFVLVQPKENAKEVNLTLEIPDDAEEGAYYGNVTVQYTVTYGKQISYLLSSFYNRNK
jgi:uncharacterized membrane protein